jgi:hypothetical protein
MNRDAAWRVAQYAALLALFVVGIMNYDHPHGPTPMNVLQGGLVSLVIGITLMRWSIWRKKSWLASLGIAMMLLAVFGVLTRLVLNLLP